MKEFKDYVNHKYRTPEQSMSDLSMSLSLFSLSPDRDFSLIIHEESDGKHEEFNTEETIIDNGFKFIDIDSYFIEKVTESANTSTREPSVIISNSNFIESTILIKSNAQSKKRIQHLIDYNRADYSKFISSIIKIQKV